MSSSSGSNVWVSILKFAITVLSAIAAALGVQACS